MACGLGFDNTSERPNIFSQNYTYVIYDYMIKRSRLCPQTCINSVRKRFN